MDFLDDEYSSAQKFIDFWQSNRKTIYFTLFLICSAVGLFKYIEYENEQKKQIVFDHYQSFVLSIEKEDKASMMRSSKILRDNFSKSFFTSLALMRQVKVYLDAEEYEPARDSLLWLIDNTSSSEIVLIAKIKLAELDLMTKNYEEATRILSLIENDQVADLVNKLQGDLSVLHKDYKQAIDYYQVILNSDGVPDSMREILTAKINYYYQKGQKL